MKVVIIGSLKSEEKIRQAESVFLNMGCTVVNPIYTQDAPLVEIQQKYYEHIKSADLVVVIPKLDDWTKDEPGTQTKSMAFGESTCYEMAVAIMNGIPIVYWPNQGTFVFQKEE